jgi:predicted TIM-barrel fold metal-dependent hydrolase
MPGRNLIDIHAHFFTEEYRAALHSAGLSTVDGFPIPDWSVAGALELMDRNGIQTQLLSISAPGIEFVPAAAARALARKVNEHNARLVADHPTRIGGFALLPLPDVDGALAEITHALDVLKLDGIVLFTNINGTYLGDKKFDAVFDELNRRKAVVFVHPVAPPGFDINGLGFPAPCVEFPFDTTRMIMNLIASGTLRRCPNVRIIVAHGGGTLPFLAHRIGRNIVRFAKATPAFTADEVMAAFKSFYFDLTAVSHQHAIDALLTLVPPDHLLYGSDHPFMLSNLIPPAIDFVNAYPKIDEVMRNGLSNGNALKLFPRLAAQQ